MKIPKVIGLVSVLMLVTAWSTFAKDIPQPSTEGGIIHGGRTVFAKAGGDTINLMAAANDPTNNTNPGPCSLAEPIYRADFEQGAEGGRVETDGSGWTSVDLSYPSVSHWKVSDYDGPNAPFNSLRAWCGDESLAPCDAYDSVGGYGSNWNDIIELKVPVGNNSVSTQVNVTALLQHDSEPGYDYTCLSYRYEGQPFGDMARWDGESQNDGVAGPVAVSGSVTFLPEELLDGTHIAVYWRFQSDTAVSDEDCLFTSAGGCMVDDVNVRVTNDGDITDYFTDFNDGSLGPWEIVLAQGVGDFARIYRVLEDVDYCSTNYTAQVAFIDDGVAVPGTGGSPCLNWCYGPGGYIVTTTGGLAGEMAHIHNAVESPVMTWPQAKDCTSTDPDGISFQFDAYKHEDLSADSPGIFYTWAVRSADTDGSAGEVQVLTEQPWRDRNSVYWGGPTYLRGGGDVTDLMNPGRDEVQVQLAVYELGWMWGYTGDDGYPAPYFDNVTVKVFPYPGPSMLARERDLAQDNFPARGTIDYEDLGSSSVRFDIANDISRSSHLRNDPGDSVVVDVIPVRTGSILYGVPTLEYLLQPNPVFNSAMRTAGFPDRGAVPGSPAVGSSGQVSPNKWAFDLPDTGFLFPGDVLHYYIRAEDDLMGNRMAVTLPPDTTGFSDGFGHPMGYNSTFTVRALPHLRSDGFEGYEQPPVLFINDFGSGGGETSWYTSLSQIGFLIGVDFDVYHVLDPGAGVGNGIGGRANSTLLAGYSDILYTCGDLRTSTIANGDFQNDPGDDLGTLNAWLEQGDKDIFLTGDNLASDLAQSGPFSSEFLQNKMGVTVLYSDIRGFIGNQISPLVSPIPGEPVFDPFISVDNWIAFGGCPSINTFDCVELFGTSQQLTQFEDPMGGVYHYSACTLNVLNPGPNQCRVISMPVDLMYIFPNPDNPNSWLPVRVQVLKAVLTYFGFYFPPPPDGVEDLPSLTFATTNYPNPFNPSTTIQYSLPRTGHFQLSVYNVRGQLVKTLIDGRRPAGPDQTVVWDGTDNLGSAAASGIYFYEARAAGELRVGKMTLLK